MTELDLLSATVSTVTGLGPTLLADAGSDVGSALVDLQAASGEGPIHDAAAHRRPVMIDDLLVEGRQRWLDFAASAIELGCSAVWSLPLGVGAARLGVLEMSFERPQLRNAVRTRTALAFAEIATETTLDVEAGRDDAARDADASRVIGLRAEVYQAQGMVLVALGTTLTDALARMRAHAFALDIDLDELARRILDGTVRLDEH
ncbi:hypothetical protein [Solicola sp. PLA-1-18]|uniref:hypothetical protein n=1 Tax=Solicola sp. PLA-1-18 TaxID=3380532 RepID=UPI003B81D69D